MLAYDKPGNLFQKHPVYPNLLITIVIIKIKDHKLFFSKCNIYAIIEIYIRAMNSGI